MSLRESQISWREKFIDKIMLIIKIFHLNKLLWRISFSKHFFTDYFKGFEEIEVVKEIFGEKTEETLGNLKIELTWLGGYMWINPSNGNLMIYSNYLKKGDKMHIYLDVIHELVHVRQYVEGKELFDSNYNYVNRPTEIEAYQYAVKEAKNLGLNNKQIREYLKTEWMNEEDLNKLAKTLGIKC
jgi:hypothetical protein